MGTQLSSAPPWAYRQTLDPGCVWAKNWHSKRQSGSRVAVSAVGAGLGVGVPTGPVGLSVGLELGDVGAGLGHGACKIQ